MQAAEGGNHGLCPAIRFVDHSVDPAIDLVVAPNPLATIGRFQIELGRGLFLTKPFILGAIEHDLEHRRRLPPLVRFLVCLYEVDDRPPGERRLERQVRTEGFDIPEIPLIISLGAGGEGGEFFALPVAVDYPGDRPAREHVLFR